MRLPPAATNMKEIVRYFTDRARQGLLEGWRWDGRITPLTRDGVEWGARTRTEAPDGAVYQSLYVLDDATGQGHFTRYFAADSTPIVTAPSCDIEAFLDHRGIPYTVSGRFTETLEYRAVEEYFGDRVARRSGVHYMNHIDEGLGVLGRIGASEAAMRAYCLHPLVQADEDLGANAERMGDIASDAYVTTLALEYRNVANGHLSLREHDAPGASIALGPLPDVHDMLRADKVQNYKDFLLYHDGSHPRTETLHRYFQRWLERLGISTEDFEVMRAWLDVDGRVVLEDALEV